MRLQGVLAGLGAAVVLGLVLLFVGGLTLALAVALPVAVILAALFGRVKVEVTRHDT